MGYAWSAGFLETTDFDTALLAHCTGGCYPPIHSDFIPFIKEAIINVADENYDEQITLPNGIILSSDEIVHKSHTGVFVDYLLSEDYDE